MPSALLRLYEIDASNLVGGAIYRFTNEVAEGESTLSFDGNTYEANPVNGIGYQKKADGTNATPQLTVADPSGVFWRTIKALGGIPGAKVTRRQIRADDLGDASLQKLPDIYYVSQPSRTGGVIAISLRSALDTGYQKFPGRIIASLLD